MYPSFDEHPSVWVRFSYYLIQKVIDYVLLQATHLSGMIIFFLATASSGPIGCRAAQVDALGAVRAAAVYAGLFRGRYTAIAVRVDRVEAYTKKRRESRRFLIHITSTIA